MTFDDVYDRLVALKTDYVLVILTDSIRYSSDKQEQHAFVAGILHTLSIQLVSLEFDSLEASLMSMHTIVDDDGEGQPRSDEPDDDPPTA